MGRSRNILLLTLTIGFLLLVQVAYAQVNRYIVHFTDKDGTSFGVDNPAQFLSGKSIERRNKQGIGVLEEDLPVNTWYVDSISKLGIPTYFKSKWFNSVLIECDESEVSSIEAFTFVDHVEYVAPGPKLTVTTEQKDKINRHVAFRTKKAKATSAQNEMLGINLAHDQGYTGEGMAIAIFDGGFSKASEVRFFDHLYDSDKVKYTLDYVTGEPDVYRYTEHGTEVFSILGAYKENEYVGTAYNADYFLFVTEDNCGACEHRIEEYNWAFAAEFADSAGVDVINSSLGYNIFEDPEMSYTYEDMDGNTTIVSQAANKATLKGMIVVTSAGNEGNLPWKYITAPADAHNIVSVGAVDSDGEKIGSSSFGPTADGRMKPEFVALGSAVKVVNSNGFVVSASGTSFSAPLVAGLLTTTWQAYPDLTALELILKYKESASNAASPNNEIGYGIPDFETLDLLLSINEIEDVFSIYPNPLRDDRLVIRTNQALRTPELLITMYNTNGQTVMNTIVSFSRTNETEVEMIDLPAGVYVLKLDTGKEIQSFRIVKI